MNPPPLWQLKRALNCYSATFLLLICITVSTLIFQRHSSFTVKDVGELGYYKSTRPIRTRKTGIGDEQQTTALDTIIPISYNFTNFSESVTKSERKFWESMKPSFTCPKDLLTRVGGVKDGGKWTCGLANLGRLRATNGTQAESLPCVVYSFGVNTDSEFEAEVLVTTYCSVYAYDPTVRSIGQPLTPTNPRVHFQKLGIGGQDNGAVRTLKTLMQQNGGHKWIDILKIDVEGAEYPSLNKILEDFLGQEDNGLPIGQLLVEMHVFSWKHEQPNGKAKMVVDLFRRLESKGLRMFSYEINNFGPNCCSEFSFINTNAFAQKRFLNN